MNNLHKSLLVGTLACAMVTTLFTGCASGPEHKSDAGMAATKPKQIPLSEEDAKAIGKVEDLAAHRLPQPVVGTAGDQLSINLDLDEGKVVKRKQRRPF